MPNTLTAKVNYSLRGRYTGDDAPGAQAEQFVYELAQTLTDGSGAGQADVMAHFMLEVSPYMLGGSAADPIKQFNLNAMVQTLWGESFSRDFAKLKLLYVEHLGAQDTQILRVGTWAAAAADNNIWPVQTDSIIGPGDHFMLASFTDGYTVTAATDHLFYCYADATLGANYEAFDIRVIALGVAA